MRVVKRYGQMIKPKEMKEEDKVYVYTLRTSDGELVENRGVFDFRSIFYKEKGSWMTSFKYIRDLDAVEGKLVGGRAIWFREPNPGKAREIFFRHKLETKKRYWKQCCSIDSKMGKVCLEVE